MNIIEVQCYKAGCGHSPFPMARSFYDRAKRTGESWHCPSGHSQYFIVGLTDDQKRIRQLERELKRTEEWWDSFYQGAKDESRRCPWPTCRDYVYASRSSMYEHMRRSHGMPLLAVVEEVASAPKPSSVPSHRPETTTGSLTSSSCHLRRAWTPRDYVTFAIIEGTPVTALCGKTWVPSRDPERFPLCGHCEQVKDQIIAGAV